MAMVIERFAVFLVRLDPVAGAETGRTRPCVIISPDEMNRAIDTVIIVPMTTLNEVGPLVCLLSSKVKLVRSLWINFARSINHASQSGLARSIPPPLRHP